MEKPENLLTVAKAAKEYNVSAGELRKALKDANVKPDLVKAGCAYYAKPGINSIVQKLKKA